jgi:hypothetical protein
LIVGAGVLETLLKIAALIDLARRPSDEVRGSKASGAAAVSLIGSAGAMPLAYRVGPAQVTDVTRTMRLAGIEPATLRSGGARSIP